MALASCSFDRGVPATDGVSSVSCESDRDCPASADLCASLDPEDRTTRRCVVRATWPSATITGLTVVARDGSPRTRFSRNAGFSEGAILATVDGRPERLVATIDTQVVPCLRDGTSYRCAFTVTADTPEGQNLARVEVTDASGRTFADRVVVDFDFTAPRVVDDSVSTRIAAPADSPLATLGPQWAPEALGRGSVLTVSFSVDEPRVAAPRLALGALETTCARSGAAFVGSLTIDTSVPEGRWPATVRLVDDVGNARDAEVAQLVRDDTPPASSLDGLLVERRPFAAPDAGPGLSLSASFGLEPGSTVLATVRSAAFPIGVLRATADGGLPRAPLALADAQEVLVTLIDAAGNASVPSTVRRYRLHATPGEGLIDNPSDFERRPGWVPQLLVTNDLNGVGTAVRAAFDGRVERFLARPTWRRQVLDAPTFECGAALADTATGSLLIGGAWPGCPSNAPQVVSLRGAGVSGTTEVINGVARLWPTYDSLRGRFVLLSAVSGLPNLTVSQSGLARFNLPPATTFSGGAYDPRRDQTLAHGQNGELWSLQNGLWTRIGHSGRLDAGLAWVPPLDTIVVFGGLPLDGGALVGDVVRLDGGLVAQLPAGVARPHVAWDPVEHALRLVDRGRDATWLLRDGGFVAQPPTGGPIEWWAPWPARGDALLNPGSPGAAVWRDGQRLPWALGSLTGGRSRPLVVPRPERGDVLVVGGSSGGFPFDQAVSWRHGLVTAPFPATVAFGGAALVALGDGGLLALGGNTLSAGQPAANRALWTFREATGDWAPIATGAPATFGTWAWPLTDGTVLVVANERDQPAGTAERASSFRLRVSSGGVVTRLGVTGDVPPLIDICGTVDDRGAPTVIGGIQQSCDAGCTTTGSREVYRYTGGAWVRETRLRLPSARDGHACAFDPTRASWVVLGGREGNGPGVTARESSVDGGGWAARLEYTPDGPLLLREDATLAFDPSSERMVLVGGRQLGTSNHLDELWLLESATARPGVSWRLPLSTLGVPLTARWSRLTVRSRAGGSGQAPDGGALPGVELVAWVDGQWRPLAAWPATADSPGFGEGQATTLDTTWFEQHAVSVGVRTQGTRRADEAEVAVDLLELELDYELAE